MFGLINLNKASGISSRQALNRVQRLVRPAKVGHTGTLDPLASGVLVVTVGPATRLTSRIQAWPKTYRGTFLLGRQSETEDIEGNVVPLLACPIPTRAELDAALRQFTGTISQQPPAYSALKVEGRRAYQLARAGQTVSLAARQVTIHELRIEQYAYPELTLHIVCGGGTYVRSLGRDLARTVGTEAVMSALTRTAVGDLTIDTSVNLEELDQKTIDRVLLSPREAVRDLPHVEVTREQLQQLAHGHEIQLSEQSAREIAAITCDGELAALLSRYGNGRYRPKRNFVSQLTMPI